MKRQEVSRHHHPSESSTCQSNIPFRSVTGDRARLLMANILASLYLDVCGVVLVSRQSEL